MLETVVQRAFCRRERLSAPDAPVSTAFPGPRSVESVMDDANSTDFSVQRTFLVWAAETLHVAWTLLSVELLPWYSGPNYTMQAG